MLCHSVTEHGVRAARIVHEVSAIDKEQGSILKRTIPQYLTVVPTYLVDGSRSAVITFDFSLDFRVICAAQKIKKLVLLVDNTL